MSLVSDATDTAKALVTASLADDFDALRTLMPEGDEEAAHLLIALTKLSGRMVESLARERDVDPQEMWRDAMITTAASTVN